MTPWTKWALLALFGLGAAWQRTVGRFPAAPPLPPNESVRLPAPPSGWALVAEQPVTPDAQAAGRKALYRAPSGAEIALERWVSWPQRREIPWCFFPMECWYLNRGWDFQERSGVQAVAPGVGARRIQMSQGKERLLELSGFVCGQEVIPFWQQFKWRLVLERLRRQRRPWQRVRLLGPQGEAPSREAGELFMATVRTAPLQRPATARLEGIARR